MIWNWQKQDWPCFRFDGEALAPFEARFLTQGGILIGSARHVSESERDNLTIEIMSAEALKTSAIEGEILERDSLQSSLRRQFGLKTDNRKVAPGEQGIAEMLVDLYQHFDGPLDHETLFRWHKHLMAGQRHIGIVGHYRTHPEPMQIVSSRVSDTPKVYFEAPPSHQVPAEMDCFLRWFEETSPQGQKPLGALARAGIAHLYFETIHPFEDGNGRIGRAISEKSLAQGLGQPSLTALSVTIEKQRKAYYAALERASKCNEVTGWLLWFADAVLDAQARSSRWIEFLIEKTRLFDKLRGRLNTRQEKALVRMTREGPDGFTGGLSASNYVTITGAPPSTARRDLVELVELGGLIRTGERKGTRYWLPFESAVHRRGS